jgi:hypothetical protein
VGRFNAPRAPALQREPQAAPSATTSPASAQAATATTNPPPIQNIVYTSHGQAGSFDARLDRSKCLLTIQKKVHFDFLDNPPVHFGTGYSPWTPGEAPKFQADFIGLNTARWRDKFLLVPTAPCPTEPCKAVKVAVEILPVGEGEAHTTLHVGNLTGNFPPPSMGVQNTGVEGSLYKGEEKPQPSDAEGNRQVRVEHEFGHMLGLSEVNAANCGPNPRDERCYGKTASQRADIMGHGSEVNVEDYAPFAHAMNQFNNKACTWAPKESSVLADLWHFLTGTTGGRVLGLGLAGAGIGAFGGVVGAGIGAGIGVATGLIWSGIEKLVS